MLPSGQGSSQLIHDGHGKGGTLHELRAARHAPRSPEHTADTAVAHMPPEHTAPPRRTAAHVPWMSLSRALQGPDRPQVAAIVVRSLKAAACGNGRVVHSLKAAADDVMG